MFSLERPKQKRKRIIFVFLFTAYIEEEPNCQHSVAHSVKWG